MSQFIPLRRSIAPPHILPLALLLLALAASMAFVGHRASERHPGHSEASYTQAPASPLGSGAAMRNLLF